MAQTTLGFLFRKLIMDFSERAAREYLHRDVNESEIRHLRDALGNDFAEKFEAFFLPYVDSNQIENIQYLSEGGNGTVWQAVWNRPGFQLLPIVLKQPKEGMDGSAGQEKFLNEVSCPFSFAYGFKMKLVYRSVSGADMHCIDFHGITILRQGPVQGLFLVFDVAGGGSIDEYLAGRPEMLVWDDVFDLFFDIATGLEGLHKRGVAHGLDLL